MTKIPSPNQNKPDPAVTEAIGHLTRTQLSPLEEVMFNSWAGANQLEPDQPDNTFDYRKLYQQTGGKVFAPGELKNQTDRMSAIETLMKAQEAHEGASPVQQFMAAKNANESF